MKKSRPGGGILKLEPNREERERERERERDRGREKAYVLYRKADN